MLMTVGAAGATSASGQPDGGSATAEAGAACPPFLVLGTRGSGERADHLLGFSQPGVVFLSSFMKLVGREKVERWANPYSAAGLTGGWRQIVNALGAGSQLSGLGLGAYHDSVSDGKRLLAEKIKSTYKSCGAKTRFILVGFSQGAQVTADVFQNRNPAVRLSAAELAQVHGVILFGDPYFNGGSKAARGREFSSSRHGVLGRRGEFAAGAVSPPIRVHSYCHGHDPICQGPFIRIAGRNVLDPKIFGANRRLVNHENYSEFGEPQASARHFAQLGAKPSVPAAPSFSLQRLRTGSFPRYIARSSDGSLWITESGDDSPPVGHGIIERRSPNGHLTQFRIPGSSSTSGSIVIGPDGAIWFSGLLVIGRLDPVSGAVTGWETARRRDLGLPQALTSGPGQAIWYTDASATPSVNRITRRGQITKFALASAESGLKMPDITTGPDGALWFTESASFGSGPPAEAIGRMTVGGRYRHWLLPTQDSSPTNITVGPDGALWFTERTGFKIGRITTAGKITEFGLPRLAPFDITAGKDGALWFTTDTRVGRITTQGTVTTWRVPGAKSLIGIAAAPDGSFWITDGPGDALRRFVPPRANG